MRERECTLSGEGRLVFTEYIDHEQIMENIFASLMWPIQSRLKNEGDCVTENSIEKRLLGNEVKREDAFCWYGRKVGYKDASHLHSYLCE